MMAKVSVRPAELTEIRALRAICAAASEDLVDRFGPGHWSRVPARKTMQKAVAAGTLYAIEEAGELVRTFRLTDRKKGSKGALA